MALNLADWQPWKMSHSDGFWRGVHWAYRLPVFVVFAAFVLTTTFWPSPKNLAQVVSLSAAVVIGVQFWYADQGGVYVLWYLPLLLLLVFRPKLSEHRPPELPPGESRLIGLARRLGLTVRSWLRPPDRLARVA
jgi:hypothetical protein